MAAGEPVLSWLEPRLEEVPGELAEAVRDAVRRGLAALDEAGADGPPEPEAAAGAAEPEDFPRGVEPGRAAPRPLPDSASVPDTLAWIAVRELDRVADAPRDREAALRLLAADASLTWAFEAAAELDEELEGLADRSGLRGRIGRLLGRTAGGLPVEEEGSAGSAGEGDGEGDE